MGAAQAQLALEQPRCPTRKQDADAGQRSCEAEKHAALEADIGTDVIGREKRPPYKSNGHERERREANDTNSLRD